MISAITDRIKKTPFNIWYNLIFWALFCLLVCAGVTGSSLGWYKSASDLDGIVEFSGERKLFGVYRGIRGDEFIAHGTPTALQQYYHQEKFPKINRNIGLDGRNYLTLHDNGAPIRHISMIARPAVWGFFCLDLRRALAWYWLFPVFAGLWALFALMNQLFPGQRVMNALLTAAGIFSPYAAGWSFWPVNNTYGLLLAAYLAIKILKYAEAKRIFPAILCGVAAGWALSTSAMSLYVPRILPGAFLVIFVLIGYMLQERKFKALGSAAAAVSITLAIAIFSLIIFCWYTGAADAIESMRQSVYPGLRRECGGSMKIWQMFMGFLAPATIYKTAYRSQSELQQLFVMMIPALCLIFSCRKTQKITPVIWGMLGFFALIYTYQFIGFSEIIAEITFFDHGNPPRAGFALTIAQVILFGAVYQQKMKYSGKKGRIWLIASLSALPVIGALLTAPAELYCGFATFFPMPLLWMMAAAMLASYIVLSAAMLGSFRIFVVLFTILNLLPSLVFNPVCIAPEKVENQLLPKAEKLAAHPFRHNGRAMFITGNDFTAVAYSCSGGKVFNSYFQFQDKKIFELLYKTLPDAEKFNRMNHLDIVAASNINAPLFSAEVTANDRILLTFNGPGYNFSALPCDLLCAAKEYTPALRGNRSLEKLFSNRSYDIYQIVTVNTEK